MSLIEFVLVRYYKRFFGHDSNMQYVGGEKIDCLTLGRLNESRTDSSHAVQYTVSDRHHNQ
jgi:hypothetical protein